MTKNKMLRQKFDVILLMQLINLKWSIESALKIHKLLTELMTLELFIEFK